LLLLVVGASGSGKSAVLDPLKHELAGIAVHDFDEIGVPPNAMPSWRQRANEEWLRTIIDHDTGDSAVLLLDRLLSESCWRPRPRSSLVGSPAVSWIATTTPEDHVSISARAGRERRWSGIWNGRVGFAAMPSIRSGGRR
jgi:hypothetical protein